jgi:hypothetical protein
LDLKVPVADIYRGVDNEDMREFLQVKEYENPKKLIKYRVILKQ